MKKLHIMLAVFLIITMLPACRPKALDCASQEAFCVGLVTDIGKINDRSFNQSAWKGVQQAANELGATVNYIETVDRKDHAKNIAVFGDAGYDVIVTVGFELSDATIEAAAIYPNTNFIGIDQPQTEAIQNVAGLIFPEDQAGFLVGALAAMMSNTHKIGAVCGPDSIPAVWRFGEGYKAGAVYADGIRETTTEVLLVYHNDVDFNTAFVDPEWGTATAKSLIDEGAYVIFGCGGVTGNAAAIAAAQTGAYAIGVDTDQYLTLPEAAPRMLSSAMKLITPGVFDLIKLANEGKFPVGNYAGDAGYAPYHDVDSEVPADVKAEMEKIYAGLLDGSILTNVPAEKP
ncbi:MAG TPA: BMP family ABC transporter substrate-binding protein [Anaerolineales bacterium]|nr:BMP family ABC transporter substrate-binding protein [Anaerolineales bacterium]